MKTEYRKVNNGYYWFLEYRTIKTVSFLGFKFNIKSFWLNVPRPFYDKIWGQMLDSLNTEGNISSWHENLEEFIKRWPDINKYFEHYKIEQKLLEDYAKQWNEDRHKDEGKIIKL